LGYGVLFALALGGLIGLIPADRWLGVAGFFLALALITFGLLSSTFHLGHPERAWRALTQWRSSWLSREAVFALAAYPPAIGLAIGWIAFETVSGWFGLMALASAVGAAATVYCTGMIYASLPPVRAWRQPLTAPIYLGFALATGLLAVHWLLTLFGPPHRVVGTLTLLAVAGAFVMKILYWRRVKSETTDGPTMASATGLDGSGLIRMLDPPHTQTNYLLDEMGFQIGRKHARVLKMLTLLFGLFGALILTLIAMTLADRWAAAAVAFFALLSGVVGALLERWLFFAEAEHTVMLYYGGVRPQEATSANLSGTSEKRDENAAAGPSRRRGPRTGVKPTPPVIHN
jgi:DMSO reductase anchor subunit